MLTSSDAVNSQGETSFSINPYMMMPGDAAIAARRIREVLTNPPKVDPPDNPPAAVQVSGRWTWSLS